MVMERKKHIVFVYVLEQEEQEVVVLVVCLLHLISAAYRDKTISMIGASTSRSCSSMLQMISINFDLEYLFVEEGVRLLYPC